eukprot:1190126-Prorocentrum_minimum.AAC.5
MQRDIASRRPFSVTSLGYNSGLYDNILTNGITVSRIGALIYFHQGLRPVRKSVSVQVEKKTVPSTMSAWARARDCSSTNARASARVLTRGAGPRTTLPWKLYWEPWQGHMNLFSACRYTEDRFFLAGSRNMPSGTISYFVLSYLAHLVPGDDAAKMGAHSVDTVVGDGAVILDDQPEEVSRLARTRSKYTTVKYALAVSVDFSCPMITCRVWIYACFCVKHPSVKGG